MNYVILIIKCSIADHWVEVEDSYKTVQVVRRDTLGCFIGIEWTKREYKMNI